MLTKRIQDDQKRQAQLRHELELVHEARNPLSADDQKSWDALQPLLLTMAAIVTVSIVISMVLPDPHKYESSFGFGLTRNLSSLVGARPKSYLDEEASRK
jgi:hypothetical protein